MGKIEKTNGTLRLILVILAIGSVFTALVGGYTTLGNTQQEQAKAIETIKIEGCEPARQHKIAIAEIQLSLKYLTERQEKDTERILKAIEARQ